MRITHLHVRRFKSLYDVELVPTNFSVVTGPNGSGKSNLVEALAFLGEVYQFGFEFAVGRYGGIDAIAFRGRRRTTIGVQFAVRATLTAEEIHPALNSDSSRSYPRFREFVGREFYIDHSFTLLPGGAANSAEYNIYRESLSVKVMTDKDGEVELLSAEFSHDDEENWDDGIPEVSFRANEFTDHPELETLSELALGRFVRTLKNTREDISELDSILDYARIAPIVRQFVRRMGLIRAYRLNPSACRKSAILTPSAALESDGSNLPAVASRMKKRQSSAWGMVLASMQQILPDLVTIETEASPEHGLSLRFQEADRGRAWSAHEVSDGTIQALALFIAAYDPRAPIVLVEEPENAVHPWVLRHFLEICKGLREKQTILTTHSPVLLSLVRPEDVFLMWRTGGRSTLKPLAKVAPEVNDLYYKDGFDVFSLYDSGMIGEAIPGLQAGKFK